MSLASEGKLVAPEGQYRVIGVDTFEAPDADYLIGDYDDYQQARVAADEAGQPMNPVYVYNDEGRLVYAAGSS